MGLQNFLSYDIFSFYPLPVVPLSDRHPEFLNVTIENSEKTRNKKFIKNFLLMVAWKSTFIFAQI